MKGSRAKGSEGPGSEGRGAVPGIGSPTGPTS